LLRADQQSWNTWFGVQSLHPSSLYQTAFWNFNWWQFWTGAGLPVERAANTNVHVQLNNRWWLHAGTTLGTLGTPLDDRGAPRGPALSRWSPEPTGPVTDGPGGLHDNARPHTPGLCTAVREQGQLFERARARCSARRGVRRPVQAVHRHAPERVQLQAVQFQRRAAMGISARLDSVRRLDARAARLPRGDGAAVARR